MPQLTHKLSLVNARCDSKLFRDRRRHVHVQGLVACLVAFAADDDPHLLDSGTAEERRRLVQG